MEPCDCRAHPPSVTQCWGWPCGAGTHQPSPARCSTGWWQLFGVTWAFEGALLRLPSVRCSRWTGVPGRRAAARAGICICRGGIAPTHLALCGGRWRSPAAGGIRCQAPRRERRAGSIKRQEVPKHLSRCCPSPARPGGRPVSLPGTRPGLGWWATGTGGSGGPGGSCSRGGWGSVGSAGWAQGKAPAFHPRQNAGLQLSGRRAGST